MLFHGDFYITKYVVVESEFSHFQTFFVFSQKKRREYFPPCYDLCLIFYQSKDFVV
jgi:hypothetical protein